MPPTVKDEVIPAAGVGALPRPAGPNAEAASRQQPLALEVEVTVNGARTAAGSDKREPFSEATKTVVVFSNGAVIRLSSVVAPGQLLFLTNEKTKKEVVCQVVKSKNYRNVSGYVELEFTEAVAGFWGIHFPGDRSVPQQAAPKVEAPAAPKAKPYVAPVVTQTETASAAGETSAKALKPETSPLQEQLASLLFAETPAAKSVPQLPATAAVDQQAVAETASKIFAIAASEPALGPVKEVAKPTPPPSKSAFEAEEVKIPAWLEPLARNAGVPASTQEVVERKKKEAWEYREATEAAEQEAPTVLATTIEAAAAIRAPNFGSRLLPSEEKSSEASASGGTNKVLRFGAIAAGIMVLLAGGVWYLRQPPGSEQSTVAESTPSAGAAASAVQPRARSASAAPANSSVNFSAAAPSSSALNAQPMGVSHDVANPASNTNSVSPAPQSKKPVLGEVRLAVPTVNRNGSAANSNEAAPSLDATDTQVMPDGEALGAGLAVENAKQPAAPPTPLPVGGDAKQARLLSSVPPAYPAMAKNQRVVGDVRIDALIDTTGHVTTMKVVSGPGLLHQAAMEALRQWKYQPAMLDGKAVATHLTVTIQFRLQ
jgi:protein TonB